MEGFPILPSMHFKKSKPQKKRKAEPGGKAAFPAACAMFF
jgi:hypothetical protein